MSKKIICLFFLLILMTISNSYGGITGTIAGKVIDKKTKKPLPGANIIIVDTYFGAAADKDGFFLVNNISAGNYDIKAQMIGYNTLIQKDVIVLMDLRTTLQFELEPTVLEMQEVTVIAEAPMIQKDVTATTHFITNREINQLPVQSFKEIVDIQPGVAAGHIRGGRQTEVLYLVDGFPIREAIEGKVGSELPMSSIIDMTVQTGGFNAEYGNAMSGVVNIITQDGGDEFSGLCEVSLLNYQIQKNPYDDRATELDQLYELNFGGPLFTERIKYYLSADMRDPNTRWKREDFGQKIIIFNNNKSRNSNFNGKLTMHPLKSVKLTAQGLVSLWDWNEYDHKWKKNLQGLPHRSKNSYRLSFTLVHTLNPKTFYELRFNNYNVLKSIYGASSDEQDAVQYENYNAKSWVISGDYPWWLDHQEIHNTFKFDMTSQVTKHHQLKTGAELVHYDLYKKSVQRMEVETMDLKFPQYISYDIDYNYKPVAGSAYIQDKIEYEGMVANIGLRYDFLDPKAKRPALEQRIYGDRSEWIINHDQMENATVKQQVSPRFGVALPIGPNKELHINYGYFFQMPLFDYLYTNANLDPSAGFSPLGDPDLKPSKTISYEVSYKNQLGENMLLDFTLFNKEVSNLIDNNTYLDNNDDAISQTGYYRYVNLEKVNIWGSEIFFKRRVGEFISGKVSYTFMVAKGTGSENTEKYEWITKDTRVPISEYYLSWDQRHTLVCNLDVRKPNNWGINFLLTWNSPLPYTEYREVETIPNDGRMEVVSFVDIRMNKDFKPAGLPVSMFVEFLNIFDRKNLLWVDSMGKPGGALEDPGAWDERYRFRMGLNVKF